MYLPKTFLKYILFGNSTILTTRCAFSPFQYTSHSRKISHPENNPAHFIVVFLLEVRVVECIARTSHSRQHTRAQVERQKEHQHDQDGLVIFAVSVSSMSTPVCGFGRDNGEGSYASVCMLICMGIFRCFMCVGICARTFLEFELTPRGGEASPI